MKFIYYNPETRMGYISEPLSPEAGEVIAEGIGIYILMNIIAIVIAGVIILPFLIASGMDKFLISFLAVNRNFLIGTAITLIIIKFLTVHLSSTLIVRVLFALMIMLPILYFLLYKLHMADITISIGKRFEPTSGMLANISAQTGWFDSIIQDITAPLSKVFFGMVNNARAIDYSAFSSSLSTINIVGILLCIGKTIFWWGLLILASLLIFAIGLVAFTVIIGFPYFIAVLALILVNNLIYSVKLNYARHLKL